jgi:hypothetical protein
MLNTHKPSSLLQASRYTLQAKDKVVEVGYHQIFGIGSAKMQAHQTSPAGREQERQDDQVQEYHTLREELARYNLAE